MPVEIPERVVRPGQTLRGETGFRLTGWHVLAMLVTFFLIVASVNAYMLTMAVSTMSGLDGRNRNDRNGYDTSQNFNREEIAAARAQAARQWQSDARLELKGRMLNLAVTFRDREGRAVEGVGVTALLAHPAQRRLDRAITLAPRGNGTYAAEIDSVDAGAWGLVLEARSQDGAERLFLSRHRVILKDERR